MEKDLKFRSRIIRKWGGVIAGILGAAGLAWYISQYASEFYRLRDISAVGIGLLSGIVLTGHLLIALKFQLMAYSFDVSLPLGEAFLLTEAGGFLNIVPLNLGTGFRAAYLKKVRKLKFVDFGLGFLASMLTEFIAAGLLGMVFSLTISNVTIALQSVFLGYIVIPLMLLGGAWLLKRGNHYQLFAERMHQDWLGQFARSLVISLDSILNQPFVIVYWLLLNILTGFILGIRYWIVGKWLGYSVSFASGMVLQSVSRATVVIAVIPSGTIGLREALTGFGAVGLGESAVSGVMISTIDRIVATAWILSMGVISMFVLRKRIAKAYTPDSVDPGASV